MARRREKVSLVEAHGRRFSVFTVYTITGPDGVYVGCTANEPHVRWWAHIVAANGDKNQGALYRSMRRHGNDAFEFHLFAQTPFYSDAQCLEIDVIDQFERDGVRVFNASRRPITAGPCRVFAWPGMSLALGDAKFSYFDACRIREQREKDWRRAARRIKRVFATSQELSA